MTVKFQVGHYYKQDLLDWEPLLYSKQYAIIYGTIGLH